MSNFYFQIILLLTLFNAYLFQNYLFWVKCPDTKPKIKACAYHHTETTTSGKTTNEILIFNKCGKGKKCDYSNSNICIPKEIRLQNGKSCNYNEDCISSICLSGKCGGIAEGGDCTNGEACNTGLFCVNNLDDPSKKKCTKPVITEGTDASNSYCGVGLVKDKDNKCVKMGTVEDGTAINDGNKIGSTLMCKSGYSHQKDDKIICDSIATDPTCDNDGNEVKGKWGNGDDYYGDCDPYFDSNGDAKYYNTEVKVKSILFQDFLKDYDKLNLEDINTKEKYAFGGRDIEFNKHNLKWKTYKKYIIYENAAELYAAGLIDAEGEVVDGKDCEFDFLIKNLLGSSYIKFCSVLLAFIALLF